MQDELREAFRSMYNIPKPHDFQIDTAEKLLSGKSVILQAPTGSGKTWTALFPFLYAWKMGLPFPRKCLYAVPLRVLATQFKEKATETTLDWPNSPKIRLQTGEQQEDPTLESDLIFTTIDQVLSSALSVPYSLGYRRANMNAGAVFSSYLICDELHLFPVDQSSGQGALATLIELLRTFKGSFPFLLMTATLSTRMLEMLTQELGAELVSVSEGDLDKMGSQRKTRRYHRISKSLTATEVLSRHRSRSIAICNQVQRSISLYDDICKTIDENPSQWGTTDVVLLHSQFVKSHRQSKEKTIRDQFGKPQTGISQIQSLIVVATQAIEVGLDITCERLHSELAPANAIIQRAGRCARYEGEEGDVYIYDYYQLPNHTKHLNLPYDASLCDETSKILGSAYYNDKALKFTDEQDIVSEIHNAADTRLIEKLVGESETRWRSMNAAMFRGDREGRTRLIRKVDSRTLLVHTQPELIRNPYAWRGFSIFHGTLRNWLNELGPVGTEWILRFPVEVRDESEESRKVPTYDWNNFVHSASQIDVSPIFVIHPDLVAYDHERGFRLMPAKTAINLAELEQEPPKVDRSKFSFNYQLESYAEHIGNMLDYYQASGLNVQIALAGQRLARNPSYGISAEQFEQAMLLALVLHDVGKLQVEWQEWSHTYQQEIGESSDPDMMIVHTHYDPDHNAKHGQAEKDIHIKRPHHAAEGAYASWPILQRILGGDDWMSQVVFTAIARHHAPFVDSVEAYALHPNSTVALAEALALIGLPESHAELAQLKCGSLPQDGALQDRLIYDGDPAQWLVYALIVRILRLCDGHALEGEV